MTTFLTILTITYIIVGIGIYALTDTTKFAGKIERSLFVVPYGVVLKHMFLFVVVLWPLWLVINAKCND